MMSGVILFITYTSEAWGLGVQALNALFLTKLSIKDTLSPILIGRARTPIHVRLGMRGEAVVKVEAYQTQ